MHSHIVNKKTPVRNVSETVGRGVSAFCLPSAAASFMKHLDIIIFDKNKLS